MHRTRLAIALICACLTFVPQMLAQQVQVEEFVLDNGMTFLLVPRKGDPNVAAGWIAKVGSVNERPGITGLSHLFEHMMFKGTHTIGTKDIDEDLAIISRLDSLKAQLRAEEEEMIRRLRLGEIDDLTDPKNRSPRHQELLDEFSKLILAQRELLVSNEFDKLYTQAGASGMNAGTTQDFTVYFINVPANKLELWFWMESDRLSNPVFREFYSERDVVHEERRMRTDSTPTGKYREEFDALFWTSHPYSWPVSGWPSDLEGITRAEAQAYFDTNYSPSNIAACLVGDFDAAHAKELAERYFSRLARTKTDQEPVRTREVQQEAEKRMSASAETNPEVEIRYHSVADGHVDEPALLVMGALLSGQTGRLYKSIVLDQQIANSASAGQNGLKWAGYFEASGVAKPGHTPEEVEVAIYREFDKLKEEEVGERELQKVKNRFAANNFRRVQSNFALLIQLLIAESNRGWETFNSDPRLVQEVTPADIRRVAQKYLKDETRAVAVYYTKEGAKSAQEDPLMAEMSEEDRRRVSQIGMMIGTLPAEQLKKMLAELEANEAQAPADKQAMLAAVKQLVLQRLQKLEGGQK